MTEVWLRPNRRALTLLFASVGVMTASAAWAAWRLWESNLSAAIISSVAIAIGVVTVACILWSIWRPLLAYCSGELLVYLRSDGPIRGPIRVPIELVEGFLLGKQEIKQFGRPRVEVSTLAIRLAEKATDWTTFEVASGLGRWCGGYINIFGTWCEPLSVELVNKLNARLAEVTQQHGQARVAS